LVDALDELYNTYGMKINSQRMKVMEFSNAKKGRLVIEEGTNWRGWNYSFAMAECYREMGTKERI
jgi:hypothetical protein